ncbi:MAG: hypothetical protein RLP44_13780 [Aggregatilineales bacterium]
MKHILFFCLLLLMLSACGTREPQVSVGGPRLLGDVTLEPTSVLPTRILSPTPERTFAPATNEVLSPLQQVTVDADFVLVTPTLPPSKTPTQTPTITPTQTYTPTPTITITATATFPQFPTSVVLPVTAVVAQPIPEVCYSVWFFTQPRPASCPLNPPSTSAGVYQSFQNGFMVWVGSQDAIYVFYNDQQFPRWEVYRDQFDEGMPEEDPSFSTAPTPNLWQPRRGFGMLWRSNSSVRNRIGWGTIILEMGYSVRVQTATDGTIFISEPTGGIFSAFPGGGNWQRYAGF